MSMILVFTRKWNACYRVLRHRNRFSSWSPCAMACGWHVAESRPR
jgi:hypothetical protein